MKVTKVNSRMFGTHEIARLCHVTPPAVIRWLEEGKMPSFTTGGGHRRVAPRDLVAFMRAHKMSVPPELAALAVPRVLIVDDEPENRRLIRRVLAADFPQAEVEEAGDGFEAGHKVSGWLPSLVILDLQLPGVDGLRICQMMRADARLRAIAILAITGYDVRESRERILQAGADDFLGKPFEIAELSRRVRPFLMEER